MRGSGVAIMGTAAVEGEDRAFRAADEALRSPLLMENDIYGRKKPARQYHLRRKGSHHG
jgi:cell division protein FtsZ